MTIPPPISDIERERHVLQAAITECNRQLANARKLHDDLATDLLTDDLNNMLERWTRLTANA
jgi:chorismate mutase